MRLPTYQPNQVSQDGPTNVRVPTSVSPESFGAGLGRGVSDVGNQLARIAVREQARADDAAVTQARTAVSRWDSTNVSAYHEMAGRAAMDRAGPMEKERVAYLAEARKSLSPRQQSIFDLEMAPANNAFFHNVATRHARATNEYHDATYQDSGAAFLESVGRSAANEVQVTTSKGGEPVLDTGTITQKIGDRLAQIDVYYALDGQRFANPEAAKRADIQAALTGAHAVVLDGLLSAGRDSDASAYFDRFQKEMRPEIRNDFQRKVLVAQEAGTVTRAVGEAWAVSGLADPRAFDPPVAGVDRQTITERLKAGEDQIDAQIQDAELAKKAKGLLRANVAAQSNAAKSQREEDGAALDANIAAGAAWARIERDPRYGKLTTGQQNARATLWKNNAAGKFTVTPPATYDALTTEMVAAVQSGDMRFLDRDLRTMAAAGEISQDDAQTFFAKQNMIVKQRAAGGGEAGYAGFLSTDEQVTAASYSLYPDRDTDSDDAVKRGEFQRKANAILRAKYSQPGAKPDYEGAKVEIDALAAQEVYEKQTFLGMDWINPDDSTALADMLTEVETAELISAMQAQGIPVTAPNMAAIVRRRKELEAAGD